MYISLNWVKDFVDLNGIDVVNLIKNQFTLSCAEVEEIKEKGKDINGVITAKIVKIQNHPNSKKLHLLKVYNGETELDIVCGAPNVKEDMIVALATIGANINGVKIDKAQIGGYSSYGMCCSAYELGISADNSGLFEFEEGTKIGVDIKSILDIDDVVFEIDNKSLTNRPDMWGHYGIAREISALIGRPLKEIPTYEVEVGNDVKIEINTKNCYRYCSATMKNINKKTSSINMQIRLFYCGMRSINLLADVTNYVMLELGQPMHAFDNSIVKSIEISDVINDTQFVTLDGEKRLLKKDTMVIMSDSQPVAIAGIMGGLNSEITKNTNNVLIESACFDATTVRKTATLLGLRTEASTRYEKSLDPVLSMTALKRYIYLIKQMDKSAQISSKITDVYPKKFPEIKIEITKQFIDKYIGLEIPESKIINILQSLQFKVVKVGKDIYKVEVPSFRATKDVSGKTDLVEEVARIYGYDNILPKSIKQDIVPVDLNEFIFFEYNIKYSLATKYNLNEIHSYIWYDYETNSKIGIVPLSLIKIVNALQKDNDQIRSTLIPALLKVVMENKNTISDFGAFEIGKVVQDFKTNGETAENSNLGIVLYNKNGDISKMLVSLKNMLEYIANFEIKTKINFVIAKSNMDYISPANYYEIYTNLGKIGFIGEIHPKVKNNIEKNAEIVVAEINFDRLIRSKKISTVFEKISKYPKTTLDFNFVIPKEMLFSLIERIANSIKTDIEYKVSLLDIYEKDNEKTKNYTLHYELFSFERTLNSDEIEKFHREVISHFENNNIYLLK